MTNLKDILDKWQNDLDFREQLKKNPTQALLNAGFELSPADLEKVLSVLKLDKSKNEKLDDRISK